MDVLDVLLSLIAFVIFLSIQMNAMFVETQDEKLQKYVTMETFLMESAVPLIVHLYFLDGIALEDQIL